MANKRGRPKKKPEYDREQVIDKLDDPTACAVQSGTYRVRRDACTDLANHLDSPDAKIYLWKAIEAFQNYRFQTAKGLSMYYTVKGGEIFFNRKEKSVTKATVIQAFHKAREVQKSEGCVSGPKKLGSFGASYLYPVFIRIGVWEGAGKRIII